MDAFDWQRLRAVGSDVKKEVQFAVGAAMVGAAVITVVGLMSACLVTDRVVNRLSQIAEEFLTLDDTPIY